MPDSTPVLIIGGGPVGLSLAAELGWRGTPCMLIEERTAPTAHPKATLLGARSMEYFRRWGIADEVFAAAIPEHLPYSITFSTRLAGHLIHRIDSPSIRDTKNHPPEVLARNRELTWSPYYKTQIGQQALEPVLWRFAARQPGVTLLHGWRFLGFTESAQGVTARIVEIATGHERTVHAQYLVGCDGGTSVVRRQLGIRYNGRGQMRANVSFYFRSTDFLAKHQLGICNLYFIFTPDSFGLFTAIDGHSEWLYQYYFLDPSKQTRDLDARDILWRAMGTPFDFELRAVQHWHHHQSVARQWRSNGGRVFLAGDAAHLFVPTGGVGMNTGIGDAIDLGWKLHAVLEGWGGETLLASYEAERKPIAVRNSVISANNSDKIDMVMDETPVEIEQAGPDGDAMRTTLQKKIRWMAKQFSSAGTHLGYRYVDSPIVVADGTPEPPDDFTQVVPTTWPGSRAPHAWRSDGASTLDWFGRDFVLVRTNAEAPDAKPMRDAAQRAGVPLRCVTCDEPVIARLFERSLVLVRPDGHVAWRGATLPENCGAIIDRARGAGA